MMSAQLLSMCEGDVVNRSEVLEVASLDELADKEFHHAWTHVLLREEDDRLQLYWSAGPDRAPYWVPVENPEGVEFEVPFEEE